MKLQSKSLEWLAIILGTIPFALMALLQMPAATDYHDTALICIFIGLAPMYSAIIASGSTSFAVAEYLTGLAIVTGSSQFLTWMVFDKNLLAILCSTKHVLPAALLSTAISVAAGKLLRYAQLRK